MLNNELPIPTSPSEQFIERSSNLLTTTVAAIIEKRSQKEKYLMGEVAEEGIGEYVEREKCFMRAVLGGFERWSKDPNNVVLWDIDDTLGKVKFYWKDEREWFFRPAMQILIPYLKSQYPDFKNGFITTRGKDGIAEDFSKYESLLKDNPLFDLDLVFSTRDIEVFYEDENNLFEQLHAIEPRTDSGTVHKYTILEGLKRENPNNNYRVIDDNAIAKIAGNNGVDVYHIMPMLS